ncbi:transmembrane protein, putative [Medicago truncatula]|uniref:Transmembrane protein, putative n=1 Tax=Medicago truncatula TaxID=3880 RepID=G7KFC1_MEDTR|nr:transmembrane protein, putative [Medicago truncatula]
MAEASHKSSVVATDQHSSGVMGTDGVNNATLTSLILESKLNLTVSTLMISFISHAAVVVLATWS